MFLSQSSDLSLLLFLSHVLNHLANIIISVSFPATSKKHEHIPLCLCGALITAPYCNVSEL